MRELQISMWSARRDLRRYVDLTETGQDVLVTSRGKPLVRLAACSRATKGLRIANANKPIFARIGADRKLLRVVP